MISVKFLYLATKLGRQVNIDSHAMGVVTDLILQAAQYYKPPGPDMRDSIRSDALPCTSDTWKPIIQHWRFLYG